MTPPLSTRADQVRHYAAVRARLCPPQRVTVAAPATSSRARIKGQTSIEERVRRVLRWIATAQPTGPEAIIRETAIAFDVTEADILGVERKHVMPRHIAMTICRLKLGHNLRGSYPRIGEAFGGRDHSTVINAVENYRDLVAGVIASTSERS